VKLRIIFLGTNGWFNTSIGNTTCILIESKDCYIILDAGDGLYKIDRFIKTQKPIYLFLSHFHLDHITGLHSLNKFKFPQGLRIYGYKGIKEILNKIISFPYTVALDELPYSVKLFEVKEGRSTRLGEDKEDLPFFVEGWALLHSVPCFGYRLEIDNKIIAYCLDTGICDNALRLAEDADLLLCECSLKVGETKEDWPHLNPQTAAQIAQKASAKELALIHFNPHFYPTLADRKRAEREAKKIFPNTFSGQDDMEVRL